MSGMVALATPDRWLCRNIIFTKFAEELIDYFRNINSGDREKAYDFMRQFTISGMNMLEHFLRSIGEWVKQKVAGMSR